MQNLLRFIQKYGNFLVFLLLEVVAFLFIISNNAYPRSSFFSTANSFIGWQYEVEDYVRSYFHLREINEQLSRENTELKNQLMHQANLEEQLLERDSSYIYAHLQYTYIPAKVIQFTHTSQHNYMTLNKGRRDGIERGMGVVNQDGVIGIVVTVSSNFAVVMPIINEGLNVSCRLKRNNQLGSLVWDGKDERYAGLTQIEAHIPVFAGDTLTTSGITPAFPPGIIVGLIDKYGHKRNNGQVTYRIRLHTDFNEVSYVQVIKNAAADELKALEDELE